MESCDSPPDWSDDSDVSSHEMNAQTSRPLATELPASAAGEGGATSAVGDEASVQMFSAEVKKEKTEEEPEHKSAERWKKRRKMVLAWLNEKEDGKKTQKDKKQTQKDGKKEKRHAKEKEKSKKQKGADNKKQKKEGRNKIEVKKEGRNKIEVKPKEENAKRTTTENHSAVGDKKRRTTSENQSAVGDKKKSTITLTPPNDEVIVASRCWACWLAGSALWRKIGQESAERGSVVGCGTEPYFFEFSFFDKASDGLLRNHNYWVSALKTRLRSESARSATGCLLDSVSQRPCLRRTLSSTGRAFTHNPCYDMLGLLTKYNWEFRHPCPKKCIYSSNLDVWHKVAEEKIDSDLLAHFSASQFQVDVEELRESPIWDKEDVDWTAWGSSMIVPAMDWTSASTSAIGDKCFYVRKVLSINFPGLCCMLQKYHTADEIEEAWLHMPLVKRGKANRGSSSGQRMKQIFG